MKWSSLALALVGTSAGAASPPDYDVLLEQDSSPRLGMRAPLQSHSAMLSPQAPAPDLTQLGEGQEPPSFIWANRSQEPLTALRARQFKSLRPDEAAREQLTQYLPRLGHASLDSAGARLKGHSQDASGVTVLTFAQQVDGLPVFRQELKVLLDKDNTLVALSGGLSAVGALPPSGLLSLSARTRWTPAQAIASAYQDLTGTALSSTLLEPMSARAGDDYTHYQLASYARPLDQELRRPPRARPVLYPLPGRLEPAYYLEINTSASTATRSEYYAYVLSATDGRLLMRHNLTGNRSPH